MSILKRNIPVRQLSTGHELSIPVWHISGSQNGPVAYIQANIHGSEVQGNAVIFSLLEYFEENPPLGDIILVPHANPYGENVKIGGYTLGRFDPTTGDNWNRLYHYDDSFIAEFAHKNLETPWDEVKKLFKERLLESLNKKLANSWGLSHGEALCCELQKMASQADIVLDLHTGPASSHHLYAPLYAQESTKHFNIPHVLLIPNEFDGAMDEASFCPWWKLQEEFARLERDIPIEVEAYTVELGHQEIIDLEQARKDRSSLLSYLSYKGVVTSGSHLPERMDRHACKLEDYKILYTDQGGLVDFADILGQQVGEGDLLCKMLQLASIESSSKEGIKEYRAPMAGIPILHFPSATIHQGQELLKMFTNTFLLTQKENS